MLNKSAIKIKKADYSAMVNRINWRPLDNMVTAEFNSALLDVDSVNVLGSLYLNKREDIEPLIKSSFLPYFIYINSIHIYTGQRFLGLKIPNEERKALHHAMEKNAQLWYSQSPTGDVMVFVAPYESDMGEFLQKEIIIAKYKNANKITKSDIKKHFSIFFKYCACTSQHSAGFLSSYLYREYLLFKDFRYQRATRQKLLAYLEKIAFIVIGGLGVWATLYVGGKL